jgi:hypothetical protein
VTTFLIWQVFGRITGKQKDMGEQFAVNKQALLGQAARAVQLMRMWRGAVAVIDEVDIVLHPLKSELNWPLGDRHPLDFAPTRWELPWVLLDALLAVHASVTTSPGANGTSDVDANEALNSLMRIGQVCVTTV